jgi:hypothetical protein
MRLMSELKDRLQLRWLGRSIKSEIHMDCLNARLAYLCQTHDYRTEEGAKNQAYG